MSAVAVKVPLEGLNSSAAERGVLAFANPPVTSTFPSLSNVDVWIYRTVPMLPVGANVPLAGFENLGCR